MKKIILLLVVFSAVATAAIAAEPVRTGTLFPGSVVLTDENGNSMPDTTVIYNSATRTYIFDTRQIKDLYVDITADQDATVVITPLPAYDNDTVGAASDTLSVTASTPARGLYSDIAAPRAKVVVSNPGGTDMTSYFFTARGSVR